MNDVTLARLLAVHSIVLVMEYVPRGCLRDYLRKCATRDPTHIDELSLLRYSMEIAQVRNS